MKELDEDKAIDLFASVDAHNFDDGYAALKIILEDKNCDLGTVSFIYWRSSPDYFRRYANEKDVTRGDLEGWNFVHYAERMLLSGKYPALIHFDPKTESHTGYTSDPSILVRDLPSDVYKVIDGKIGPEDMVRGPGKVLATAGADNVSRLKVALEEVDGPDFRYGDFSPLIIAAKKNALNSIKYLLDNGADINFKGRDNYRAIHEARTVRTVKLLIECGAKLDLKCTYGTAAHLAAQDSWNGYEDGVLEQLVKGGAKPNVKDRNGATALHAAARHGRVENFKLLLAAGWDLNAVDKKGFNVMHHCVDFPGHNFTRSINRSEMLEELLKLGVSAETENNAGQSAKSLATKNAKWKNLGTKEHDKFLELLEIEATPQSDESKGDMAILKPLYERRNKAREEENYEILVPVLKEIIAARPNFINTHEMELAKAFAHLNDSENALHYADKSLASEGSTLRMEHMSKCEVLNLLGRKDEADKLAHEVLHRFEEDIKHKENDPSIFGLPHRNKAAVLVSYFQDYSGAAEVLQIAVDKGLYNNEFQLFPLVGTIHAYKAGINPIGSVGSMLGAIMLKNHDETENNRDRIEAQHIPQIVGSWNSELPWDVKDGYIHLLLDQTSDIVFPIMEDGLESPTVENRACALCILSAGKITFEDLQKDLTDQFMDKAIAEWKAKK